MSFLKTIEKRVERRGQKEKKEKRERKEKMEKEMKEDKKSLEKMFRYTLKKALWLINYSLSFSKKDSSKEIGIKLVACFVILQVISLTFFMISTLFQVILLNPVFSFGLLVLTAIFILKKEIRVFLKSNKKDFISKKLEFNNLEIKEK